MAEDILRADAVLATARHTVVEVRRNLARLLSSVDAESARDQFSSDLNAFLIVELDAVTCEAAAIIGEQTGVRSLDALHLAAAQRVGGPATSFATFDIRQAQAARLLGLVVQGA